MILALLMFVGSAQASGSGVATVFVTGSTPADRHYHVVPPAGWTCNLTDGSGDPQGLSCYDDTVQVPHCGTVTAAVTSLTGTLGAVEAIAICGNAQSFCTATVVANVASPCSISVSGNGLPACTWVTLVGVNFNYVASCTFSP